MIIYNEYKEFQREAQIIDERMFFTNMYIYRGPINSFPKNENGKIYIPNTDNVNVFSGELVHENAHNCYDPITFYNYLKGAYAISKELKLSEKEAIKFANISSDLIVEFQIAKDKEISMRRKKGLEEIWKGKEIKTDIIRQELLGIYKKLHNVNVKARSKYFKKIANILESMIPNDKKYVEITKIMIKLQKRKEKKKKGEGEGESDNKGKEEEENEEKEPLEGFDDIPIIIKDPKEIEKEVENIYKESKNIEEVYKMLLILKETTNYNPTNEDILIRFYESQARKANMSIVFPERITNRGIKIGGKKWIPSYGINAINVKKTFFKYGVNVPYVTTQTDRILNKFISSNKSPKPVDIVVSIDCSGSTQMPEGNMNTVADYEVVMLYSLINLAKRNDQKIGLTLWSNHIEYTSLPKMYDWRECDQLKRKVIWNWRRGFTEIILALKQANDYKDKLFFIFTDGAVSHNQLIEADNVLFFLIMPREEDYNAFVRKYGTNRVIVINNVEDIPTITLKHYVKIIGGR